MLLIKNAESFQTTQVLKFVDKFSYSTIYCDPRFIKINSGFSNIKSIQYMIIDTSGSIRAYCIGSVFSEFHGIRKFLTTRAVIRSGILYDCREALDFLLFNINKDLRRSAIYIRIPVNNHNIKDNDIFSKHRYIYEPHINYIMDLSKGTDHLWKTLHPTRRKQINRGLRRNIKAEIATDIQDIAPYYKILLSTYLKAGLPLMDMSYFKRIIEEFSLTKQLVVVRILKDHELIAHRIVLAYNKTLYDWFAGSNSQFHDHYPNDIAVWEILRWGSINGYKYFDFGGAGNPNSKYGVRDFKRKFGGNLIDIGLMSRINQPGKFLILTIFRKIWSYFIRKNHKVAD